MIQRPLRIESRADLQLHQQALRHCYLCGSPLVRRDSTQALHQQHVPPLKALESSSASDALSPSIPVHDRCLEKVDPAAHDAVVELCKSVPNCGRSLREVQCSSRPQRLRNWFAADALLSRPIGVPRIEAPRCAAIDWMRGLFSLVYGTYMPVLSGALGPGVYFPPLEPFDERMFSAVDELGCGIATCMAVARAQSRWDGIAIRDGGFAAAFTWLPAALGDDAARCLWAFWRFENASRASESASFGVPCFVGWFRTLAPPGVRQTIGIRGLNDESNTAWRIAW